MKITRLQLSFSFSFFSFDIRNKAGYTATEVACGWAGAVFEVTRPFGQEQWGLKIKIHKKSSMWPTNWQTDRPTKQGVESHSTRLKRDDFAQVSPTVGWSLTFLNGEKFFAFLLLPNKPQLSTTVGDCLRLSATVRDQLLALDDIYFTEKLKEAAFFRRNVNIWQKSFLICLCQEDKSHEASISLISI